MLGTHGDSNMTTQAVGLGEIKSPRFVHSIAEAEVLAGVSRSTIYRLIASGRLNTVKLGRRRLVPVGDLARLCGAISGDPSNGGGR
jgi:excisionase family DNA binding protein